MRRWMSGRLMSLFLLVVWATIADACDTVSCEIVSREADSKLINELIHLNPLLNPIKDDIKEKQYAITNNPYKDDVAHVRRSVDPVAREESEFRDKRFSMVKAAQERFLGMSLHDSDVLEIGLSLSGGGYRAMLGALGSLNVMQETGLLDCIMSMAGLSGSTWLMAPWITSGMSLADYKEYVLPKLRLGLLPDQLHEFGNTANALLVKFAYEQPLTTVDVYGCLLANTLLEMCGKESMHACLSSTFHDHVPSHAKRIAQAEYPLPIYTAVLGDMDSTQEWFEFTPYEVGCREFGAFVPTWAFGRRFKNGVSTDNAPEQTLGYLMGICGSAFGGNFEQAYDMVLKKFINDPFWREVIEFFAYTEFGKLRLAYAQVPNFMHKLSGTALSKRKTIKLVDAGLEFNNPVFATYRDTPQGDAPDLVFVFDYGSAIGNHELSLVSNYAQRKELKFPSVKGISAGSRVLTVLKDENDPEIPTVLYLPRIKDEKLLTQYEHDARYSYYTELLADLDWEASVRDGFAATINMQYTKEQAEKVCGLMEFNLRTQIERIREIMKQRVFEKRRLNREREMIA